MLKLLYKPTGNIFTLPDEEALNIKKNDRGNDYVIMEAGLQEKKEEVITHEEVKAIEEKVAEQQEADKKADEEAEKEVVPEEKSSRLKTFDVSDLSKLTKKDLEVIANKLGIFDVMNKRKDDIIKLIEEGKGNNQ